MSLISLTTDFGTRDWFVGTMKGVILSLNPRAQIVDLSHEIPPGDIRAGAFALMAGQAFFPKGTVHVVVVDPGVGSERGAVAVQTASGFFVAPDNGVLWWALRREKIKAIHQLTNQAFFLDPVSRTFHGRDIFAPVAAHLSQGAPLRKLGPRLKDLIRLEWPQPARTAPARIEGEIVYVDRFGNLITNLDQPSLSKVDLRQAEVFAGRRRLCRIAEFYQAVPVGQPIAVLGSTGFLELAINGGSAARTFRVQPGDAVRVQSHLKRA